MPNRDEENLLEMWTVYDHPSDMPEKYVARLFFVTQGGAKASNQVVIADTLEEIRSSMKAHGLTRLERYEEDDPVILEVWL